MTPRIPGQILPTPGPALNTSQLRGLLDQLYRKADRDPVPFSGKHEEIDISKTDDVTHVYVRVDKPGNLCPKWEGPYEILERPSRSQVTVRIGKFKSGEDRTLNYHWSACKPAYLRPDAVEGSRPALGRRPKKPDMSVTAGSSAKTDAKPSIALQNAVKPVPSLPPDNSQQKSAANAGDIERGKIQTAGRATRSSRNQNPVYK